MSMSVSPWLFHCLRGGRRSVRATPDNIDSRRLVRPWPGVVGRGLRWTGGARVARRFHRGRAWIPRRRFMRRAASGEMRLPSGRHSRPGRRATSEVGEDEHGGGSASGFAGEVGAGDLDQRVGALLRRGAGIVGGGEFVVGACNARLKMSAPSGSSVMRPDRSRRSTWRSQPRRSLPVDDGLTVGAVAVEIGVEGVAIAVPRRHVFGRPGLRHVKSVFEGVERASARGAAPA